MADLTTYYNNVGQTEPYTPTLISTGGYSTSCTESGGCDDTEQTLDMTQAMGMDPGSTMLYRYVCGDASSISDTACISAMVFEYGGSNIQADQLLVGLDTGGPQHSGPVL